VPRSRTPDSPVQIALVIFELLVGFASFVVRVLHVYDRTEKGIRQALDYLHQLRRDFVRALPYLVLFALIIIGGVRFGQQSLAFISRQSPTVAVRVLAAVVVLAVGYAAYSFKRKHQMWYGFMEIVVGMITAFTLANAVDAHYLLLSQGTAFVGSVYVVARGFSNMRESARSTESVGVSSVKLKVA
jgi:hypothetical protein